ncbi:MAG: hypothetical protein OXK17_06475 [Thaumarchaeota archaeon]|nr:hypothetical protein [Nitrososphaerota archaeon]
MMAKNDWTPVSVKKALLSQVQRALPTPMVKDLGLNNMSEFVDYALRETLGKIELKRFSHISTDGARVCILDSRVEPIGRLVSVMFHDDDVWCEYCDENVCVHIQYVWEIPEVRKALEKRNLKRPTSRPPAATGNKK